MTTSALKKPLANALNDDAGAGYEKASAEALQKAQCKSEPFKHWLFEGAIPMELCHEITSLPIKAVEIEETYGKRDSHNNLRKFFTPELQQHRYAVRAIADLFQSKAVVKAIENLCGIDVQGSYLRIEYCQDVGSFWLEPHMDIKEKLMTMQIYLNSGEGAEKLGTDMYDHDKKWHSSAPSQMGQGMIFIPKEPQSWHGFEKRNIPTVRRSLIINYVTNDWRATHELAFPEQPIAF
jgi:hypothetical protein